MGRDIRIEELNNGYVIRAWDEKPEPIYGTQSETVAASAAEVKDYVDQWLKKEAPPFKKDTPGA